MVEIIHVYFTDYNLCLIVLLNLILLLISAISEGFYGIASFKVQRVDFREN